MSLRLPHRRPSTGGGLHARATLPAPRLVALPSAPGRWRGTYRSALAASAAVALPAAAAFGATRPGRDALLLVTLCALAAAVPVAAVVAVEDGRHGGGWARARRTVAVLGGLAVTPAAVAGLAPRGVGLVVLPFIAAALVLPALPDRPLLVGWEVRR